MACGRSLSPKRDFLLLGQMLMMRSQLYDKTVMILRIILRPRVMTVLDAVTRSPFYSLYTFMFMW